MKDETTSAVAEAQPVDLTELKTIVVDINSKRVEGIVLILMRLTEFQPQLKLLHGDACHENEVAVVLGDKLYEEVQEAIAKIQIQAEKEDDGKIL